MRRYAVVLMPDAGGYAVVVPALPGCVTQGDSVEEALEMARDAIQLRIEALAAHDEEIPEADGPALLCVLDV
ncbi:MAG TPA: type II toxin-antitoxin system HicB family antitoxin [Chloroflexota bacterium]|nr:type II toxin-antitoxin system HicB family antitoxin [Chloroflexota bacterium]